VHPKFCCVIYSHLPLIAYLLKAINMLQSLLNNSPHRSMLLNNSYSFFSKTNWLLSKSLSSSLFDNLVTLQKVSLTNQFLQKSDFYILPSLQLTSHLPLLVTTSTSLSSTSLLWYQFTDIILWHHCWWCTCKFSSTLAQFQLWHPWIPHSILIANSFHFINGWFHLNSNYWSSRFPLSLNVIISHYHWWRLDIQNHIL